MQAELTASRKGTGGWECRAGARREEGTLTGHKVACLSGPWPNVGWHTHISAHPQLPGHGQSSHVAHFL